MKRLFIWVVCGLLAAPLAAQEEAAYLDVSIEAFTPAAGNAAAAVPNDSIAAAPQAVSTEIRNAEARYLALYLRYRLEASGLYGAVRVVPAADPGADLALHGAVLESDGSRLVLRLSVSDSRGQPWVDQVFSGTALPASTLSGDPLLEDDFAGVFGEFLQVLRQALERQTAADLDAIRQQALLNYGASLAPRYFTRYFRTLPDGTSELVGLPADDDPLLGRISAIREREYVFVDVVDQQYRRFYDDIRPVYQMWRSFRREQADSAARVEARESDGSSRFRRGSYYALQDSYNNYRWAKLQELYLDELNEGFANETEPTQIELDDSLFRLTGSMEQQYREWRGILAELLELELGGGQ